MVSIINDKFLSDTLEAIRELGPIKGNQLAEYLNCSLQTVSRAVAKLRDEGNLISSSKIGYSIKQESMKNSEGYSDPTAYLAISGLANKMMNNSLSDDPIKLTKDLLNIEPGSIIAKDGIDKCTKRHVIVSSSGHKLYCFPVYFSTSQKTGFFPLGHNYHVDTKTIITLDIKKEGFYNEKDSFLSSVAPSILSDLKSAMVNDILGYNLDEQKRNEEKDRLLLEQRSCIWEKAFYAVCGKINKGKDDESI